MGYRLSISRDNEDVFDGTKLIGYFNDDEKLYSYKFLQKTLKEHYIFVECVYELNKKDTIKLIEYHYKDLSKYTQKDYILNKEYHDKAKKDFYNKIKDDMSNTKYKIYWA